MPTVCPWDRWLRFRCPHTENAYMNRAHELATSTDRVVLVVSVVCVGVKALRCTASGWDYLVYQLGHMGLIGICVTLMWLSMIRKGPYSPHNAQGRLNLVSCFRLTACCLDALGRHRQNDHPDLFHPDQTLMRVIAQASLGCVMLEGLGLGLPFKRHLLVHGAISAIRMSWILRMYSKCCANESLAHDMNEVGHVIEDMLIRVTVLGFPVARPPPMAGEYPCWLVGAFWHAFVEFILPMLVVFVVECRWRIHHLKSNGMPNNVNAGDLKMFFFAGMAEKTMISTIGAQALWFTLKGIANGKACREA